MRYAISYVSTVNPALSETEIQEILDFSKNWNNDHHISGILLYSQGNFFQVLEGDKDLITSLFKRIKGDKRHHAVIPIFQKEIPDLKFEGYQAGFISLDANYKIRNINAYISQIHLLNPAIQSPVKFIIKKFSEGIK